MLRLSLILFISLISPRIVVAAPGDKPDVNGAPTSYSEPDPKHAETTELVKRTATPSAHKTGEVIANGLDSSKGGTLDPARMGAIQAAANSAMDQSAYIDQLYMDHKITRSEWLALKAGMTAGMMAPINNSAANAPSQPKVTASKKTSAPNSSTMSPSGISSSTSADISVEQPMLDSKRSLASVPESDPSEVGAGAQVLSLNSAGPAIIGTTLVQDKISDASNSENLKESGTQKQLQMDESAKLNSSGGQTVVLGASSTSKNDKAEDRERAMLMAQKILQEHNSKVAKKNAVGAGSSIKEVTGAPTASPVEVAQAKAMASLQGLPKVKRVQGLDGKDSSQGKFSAEEVSAALALSKNRSPASVSGDAGDVEEGLSNTSLFLIGLLGLFAGLAVAYGLFMRPQKSVVQLMVPGAGEHFSIRPGSKEGEFILDIKDIRGKLVKTAGTLRPNSVTRASVLPPDLAARLGAKGNFERFELNADGEFVATEKEEGYQVFPFEITPSKRAS